MKIKVNEERCIGCGECYAVCPIVFTLNDAGIAEVRKDFPQFTKSLSRKLNQAEKHCPTKAISVQKC